MAINKDRRDDAPMNGLRIVNYRPGGPFTTLTILTTVSVAIFLSVAAAGIVLMLASLFASGVLLASALRGWLARGFGSSGPDLASWRIDEPLEPVDASGRRAAAPVAKPYLPLHAYLEHRHAWNVVLTFAEIESLLGFSLPTPARTEREWWTAQTGHNDKHADTWTVAGRTAMPNLVTHTVAFTRVS